MSIPKPISCVGCVLASSSSGFSSLEGSGSSGLLVVSEALGEHEEADGLPLRPYAPAGSVFQRTLDELHLQRSAMTLTNCIRCQPPGNELRDAPYEFAALNHCKQYLNATIAERQPKAILALGAVPLRELLDMDSGVPADLMSVRGFLLRSKYSGIPLIATYHPAHLMRGSMHLLSAVLPDVKFAYRVATEGTPKLLETNYELFPTIDDVRRFYHQLAADQSRPVAVDVETIELLGERDATDWRRKTLIQIQFSDGPGRAIVLPWTGRFIDAAKAILALDNPKWTWNGRLSDLLVLRGSGCTVNGEHHDLMNALIHLQPSFTAGRDDKFGDKGIVTKLLGLQSCASFYCPEVGPWKHLAYERDKLQMYGAYDADYTMRCGIGLFADLKAQELWDGYNTFKRGLCEVLDDLGEVGLPIDRERQQELRTYTLGELDRLQKALQPLIPEQLHNRHPKEGWRSNPSSLATVDGEVMKLRDAIAKYDSYEAPPYVTIGDPAKARVSAPTEGHLVYREFELIDENAIPYTETRWCLLKPFNPGSQGESGQVGRYISFMGYPMPHKIDDPSKGTVGKDELEKLAAKVNDPVLNLVVEHKDIRKTGMDYTTGAWSPGADGRVHSTFRPNTASGQTTSSNPNCHSASTEVLTKRGWIYFPDLLPTDLVAQWEIGSGAISFVKPLSYTKVASEFMNRVTTEEQLSLEITDSHRCLLRNRKTDVYQIFDGANYPKDWHQIQAGTFVGGSQSFTAGQIATIAALQADGHICLPRGRYHGGALDFGLTRARKIERLQWALKNSRIPFTLNTNGRKTRIYISADDVPSWLADKKFFGPWVLDLNRKSLDLLANEIFLWDGLSTRKNNYSSSDKVNSDWVQIIMTLSGRRAKIRTYRDPKCPNMRDSHQVDITRRNYSGTANRTIEKFRYAAFAYCVSVPSEFIVTRHAGKVAISGNCQQFPEHGGLAKRAKAMIRAEPGHVLVKVDYRGFHSRAIGHLAEDPIYYRLADFDTHSFITAHFLRLHDAPYLIDMGDAELRVALSAIKKEHGFTRNYKVKRTTHGRQFNMGLNKLYKMHADNFDPKIETVIAEVGEAVWHGWGMERQVREIAQRGRAEATKLFYLFDRLFPKTFIDFPARIEHQIHYVTRCELRSPFQCRRYFWDYDKEQSTAYLPSNTAHCHAQERLIQMRKEGYLREFGFTNWTHDAGWFHVQDNSAGIERCLVTVRSFFESESAVMVNSLGPFFCKTDAEVGPSLAEMKSI